VADARNTLLSSDISDEAVDPLNQTMHGLNRALNDFSNEGDEAVRSKSEVDVDTGAEKLEHHIFEIGMLLDKLRDKAAELRR
jgi:hypothetical protein